MLAVQRQLIFKNKFSRPGSMLKAKKGFVLHYTASPSAPAENIGLYFNSLRNQDSTDDSVDRYASAQVSVDRFNIVQHIPWNEMAYHCGSKQPYMKDALANFGTYPNATTIGIEMCIEKDGSIHEDTFNNAADLIVFLIKTEGFPNVLMTHKGVVGWKDCPLPWVKKPSEFERFKKLVNKKLNDKGVTKVENDAKKALQLEKDYMWTMLYDGANKLYHAGILTSAEWADKAKAKTLTVDELTWLNFIINVKQTGVK